MAWGVVSFSSYHPPRTRKATSLWPKLKTSCTSVTIIKSLINLIKLMKVNNYLYSCRGVPNRHSILSLLFLVRTPGLEPGSLLKRRILSPLCLPISPCPLRLGHQLGHNIPATTLSQFAQEAQHLFAGASELSERTSLWSESLCDPSTL